MPVSLLLAFEAASLAGSAVWLSGAPDPAATPGLAAIAAEAAAPSEPWTDADARAIAFLGEELQAVRPLADVFDGELQIMVRLQSALAEIHAIRPEDRDLVYSAMAFEGFAVQRYFQDKLATDPGAEQYRVQIQGRWEVAPWVDAVALNPERLPSTQDVADNTVLLAFQELRARHLLTPPVTISVSNLPPNARLVVDGRDAAVDRARVLPGNHRIALVQDGVIRQRSGGFLGPDTTRTLVMPASAQDLQALGASLGAGPPTVKLPPGVLAVLSTLDQPVAVVVPGKRDPLIYDVTGDQAQLRVVAHDEHPVRLLGRASLGAGWYYDGEFLIENYASGAPSSRATVNAFAPAASLGLELRPASWFAAGLGADLALPIGEYHDVSVGDAATRLRAYPHVALGHPLVQFTAGLLLPWRVGLGGRVHVPLGHVLELDGAYVYGIGVDKAREDSVDDFEPTDSATAWLGVGARLGR